MITVEIPRSLFVHSSPGGFLHRVADSKRSMSTEYLARMFQQRSQSRLLRFDEQIVEGAGIEDLTPDLWQRFRTGRSDDDRDTFSRKLGFVGSAEEGLLQPTVAGVLMGSEDPRRWLPNPYVQAVAYRGDAAAQAKPRISLMLQICPDRWIGRSWRRAASSART